MPWQKGGSFKMFNIEYSFDKNTEILSGIGIKNQVFPASHV